MIETSSGLIGFLEPLQNLHDVFTDERQQGKLFDLSEEFGGWRRCKGDGNCFYRAWGFAAVEAAIWWEEDQRLPTVANALTSRHEGKELRRMLRELQMLDKVDALERWYMTLLTNPALDAQLVRAVRLAAASWLRGNQEAAVNDMPVSVLVESHGMDLETFLESEVLASGKEADTLAIHAAALALGGGLEIVQLDRGTGPCLRYTVPEQGPGQHATLLFRPGHYDIFYQRELYQELAQLQDGLNLRKSCGQPAAGSSSSRSSRKAAAPPPHGADAFAAFAQRSGGGSLEEALGVFRLGLHESVSRCVATLDQESSAVWQVQNRLAADQASIGQLQREIEELHESIMAKREALRVEHEAVERLQVELAKAAAVEPASSWWACCSRPVVPREPAEDAPRRSESNDELVVS